MTNTTPGRTVRRFDELVTDDQIEGIIQKYSMGTEIWWTRTFGNAIVPIIDKNTQKQIDELNLPITEIFLGMKGHLIGPEYDVWWLVRLNAIPPANRLEHELKQAIDSMRQQKAKQLIQENGAAKARHKK